jgi:poly(glycerol-phosphate) alpha-glucosyltransferase
MGVLEAWAAGIPVLMTAACNLSVGFDEGAASEIGESSEAISAGLRAADRWGQHDLEGMSTAGRQLIRKCFSTESVSTKVQSLYEYMLEDVCFN